MTTGLAPFFLMLEREMRSKLPELGHEAPITNEEIRDWARKLTQLNYVDTDKHAVIESPVEVGDQVLLRNTKTNSLQTTTPVRVKS